MHENSWLQDGFREWRVEISHREARPGCHVLTQPVFWPMLAADGLRTTRWLTFGHQPANHDEPFAFRRPVLGTCPEARRHELRSAGACSHLFAIRVAEKECKLPLSMRPPSGRAIPAVRHRDHQGCANGFWRLFGCDFEKRCVSTRGGVKPGSLSPELPGRGRSRRRSLFGLAEPEPFPNACPNPSAHPRRSSQIKGSRLAG